MNFAPTLAADPRVVGIVVGGGKMRLGGGATGDERHGVLSNMGLDGSDFIKNENPQLPVRMIYGAIGS